MTLAKTVAALTLALCVAPFVSAQSQPVAKASKKSRAKAANSIAVPPVAAKRLGPAREAAVTPVADTTQSSGPRRDPFLPLINERKEGGNLDHLPPGKAGLVITTVRVDGTVSAPEGRL